MKLEYLTAGKFFWTIKIVVLLIALSIVFSAISLLITSIVELSLQKIVLRIYLIFFAVKIVICEIGLAFVLTWFPYIKSFVGKGMFFIFVGVLMISISDKALELSTVCGAAICLCGLGFIGLKFLGYESGNMSKEKKKKKSSKK